MSTGAPPRRQKPSSSFPGGEHILRFVRAMREAVRTAHLEWQGITREPMQDTIKGKIMFTVRVEADEIDGGYVAECLDLPGCMSQGDTEREAIENLVEAIMGVLEARMQRNLAEQLQGEPAPDEHRPQKPRALEIPVA
jgi:predicted RNase H-like HicB family nuclease